jgi:hypothetical protein
MVMVENDWSSSTVTSPCLLLEIVEGDPNFIAMWQEMGGMERFDRRRAWFAQERQRFVSALR